MTKRIYMAAAAVAAIASGGWFFRRAPAQPLNAICALSRAGADVTVSREPASAEEAAERAAAELRAAGWNETPVSVRSFHLLMCGEDVLALVAEDLPSGGSRLTTLHKRRALR